MAHINLIDTTSNHFAKSVKFRKFQGFGYDTTDEALHK